MSDTDGQAKSIEIVLADDHAIVRSGLQMLLEQQPDFTVVAEASDIESTERSVRGHRPDVLVLDINMTDDESSLPAIPGIIASSPETAVVVLTMQNEPDFAREALRNGARGYVLKSSAGAELVQAIRTALDGGTYLNPALGARMAAEPESDGLPGGLTEREAEVLKLVALGHTNGEVAEQLYLSVRTVEAHRAHVHSKLGLSTRAELVRFALDNDLIDR